MYNTNISYAAIQVFYDVPLRITEISISHVTLYFIKFIFQNRTINHAQGSHGVPGIFVKYDLSSFKVHVREEHKPFWQFLVRLCGIIGGVFATSGQCTIGLVLQLSSMHHVASPNIYYLSTSSIFIAIVLSKFAASKKYMSKSHYISLKQACYTV